MITSAIIDSRESATVKRMTFGGVPTMVMALDAGDLAASTDDGCQVLIERKTPEDLLGTLTAKRFLPQIEKMTGITPWTYVVITGTIYRDRTGYVTVGGRGHTLWNYDAVMGALLTAQEMGAGVVYCGPDDYEATVIRLCNRSRGTVRVKPPREGYLLSDGEAALAALPGIGPERVTAIMAEFNTVADALEWLTDLDTGKKIAGIAEGTKIKVRQALGLEGEKLFTVPQDAMNFYTPNGYFVVAEPDGYKWLCSIAEKTEAQ